MHHRAYGVFAQPYNRRHVHCTMLCSESMCDHVAENIRHYLLPIDPDDNFGVLSARVPGLMHSHRCPATLIRRTGLRGYVTAVDQLSSDEEPGMKRTLIAPIVADLVSMGLIGQQEILRVISTLAPPTHLAQQLEAVRLVGNFAAFPMKDTNTSATTDIEEGEAELLIETLEGLFDYVFVEPAKWTASKAGLTARLKTAGKPAIP
jgi:hypothetical protein